MNFKSLILGLTVTALSLNTFAQSSEVEKAKLEYAKYVSLKRNPAISQNALKNAQEAIDRASLHAKTSAEPATWAFRALIYAEKALLDTALADVSPNVNETLSAISKTKELDVRGQNKGSISSANQLLYSYYMARAIKSFNIKDYAGSYPNFVKGAEFMPGDTISTYYAGYAAQHMNDFKSAITHYRPLLNSRFSHLPDVYANLAESYVSSNAVDSAIKVLAEGYSKFPKRTQLAIREIELSVNSGKYKEVIPKIEKQVELNPTDRFFQFYLGLVHGALNNRKEAESAYKQAIELDSNFWEAYLNLGNLIMNAGIDLYNAANKQYGGKQLTASQQTQFDASKKAAHAEFDKALPYLQKAAELNPTSKEPWKHLLSYYKAKSNKEKIAEIEAKMKSL